MDMTYPKNTSLKQPKFSVSAVLPPCNTRYYRITVVPFSALRSYRSRRNSKTPKNTLSGKYEPHFKSVIPPYGTTAADLRYYRALLAGTTVCPDTCWKLLFRQNLKAIANCNITLRSWEYPHDIHSSSETDRHPSHFIAWIGSAHVCIDSRLCWHPL